MQLYTLRDEMNRDATSRYVVCPGINQEQRQALPETVAFFNKCSEQFRRNGIEFGFHNHSVEFTEAYGDRIWFDAFLGHTSSEDMKSELDVCWVHHAGCINSEKRGRMNTNTFDLSAGGVAFFEGKEESSSDLEARLWLECILHDTKPLVKPEQALVVTQILEAIYESSRTGKAIYFEP